MIGRQLVGYGPLLVEVAGQTLRLSEVCCSTPSCMGLGTVLHSWGGHCPGFLVGWVSWLCSMVGCFGYLSLFEFIDSFVMV